MTNTKKRFDGYYYWFFVWYEKSKLGRWINK